jgi:hypothetical protein
MGRRYELNRAPIDDDIHRRDILTGAIRKKRVSDREDRSNGFWNLLESWRKMKFCGA